MPKNSVITCYFPAMDSASGSGQPGHFRVDDLASHSRDMVIMVISFQMFVVLSHGDGKWAC